MNLFLVSLNTPEKNLHQTLTNLNQIYEIFPDLRNGKRYLFQSDDLKNFVLIMDNPPKLKGDRNYLAENNDYIFFYNGLPIDSSEKIRAHRAEEFLDKFDELKYEYEGQASIIRFNKHTNDVDIVTDNLGMEQVYYYNQDDKLLISNNIRLIENAIGKVELDLEGASFLITLGWVAGNSTLREGIKVINGGQHWKWNNKEKFISKKTHFDPSRGEFNSKEVLSKNGIKKLYEDLSKYYLILKKYFDLDCPLTGGYDSRLIASILSSKKIDANYYTIGDPESKDVKIASFIANKFDLPYCNYQIDYSNLFENWDDIIKKFVLQNNGIASLWGMNGTLIQPVQHNYSQNGLSIRLATEAAEATRGGYYQHIQNWYELKSERDFYNYLTKRFLLNHYSILKDTSVDYYLRYFNCYFNKCREQGFNHKFHPILFYHLERNGRFHANNRGIYKKYSDSFSVFCTKTYLNIASQLSLINQFSYPVHYEMMKMINREFIKLPNVHGNWPIKNPRIKYIASKTKPIINKYLSAKIIESNNKTNEVNHPGKSIVKHIECFDRQRVFETKLSDIRSVCLDQSNSEIWQLIKRDTLEKILSRKENIEYNALKQLFAIATLFYYESFEKS